MRYLLGKIMGEVSESLITKGDFSHTKELEFLI